MKRDLILPAAIGALGIVFAPLTMNQVSFPGATLSTAIASGHAHVDHPDAARAQAMVNQALKHLDERGASSLIEKVNAAGPEFHQGEIYVFVLSRDGTIVAHPIDPSLVGKGPQEHTDSAGNAFLVEMAATAASHPDGTWVDYRWWNPVTEKEEPKSSWVMMRDGHIVGAGVYRKD